MTRVTVQRKETDDQGTFGELTVDGSTFKCVTGELPFRNNVHGISCIRAGTYPCFWRFSPGHGRMIYHIEDVPCRTDIQIHSGNWCGDLESGFKSDVKGCMILGDVIGVVDGQKAVLHSKKTVQDFEKEVDCHPFELTVLDIPGETTRTTAITDI